MTTFHRRHALLATAAAIAASAIPAGPALGAYGDNYGAAPINTNPNALQDAPALEEAPGVPAQHAFWAGTCDRLAAPAPGPAPILGGFGSRPATVLAPTALAPTVVRWTPAPPTPPFTVEFPPGSGQHWADVAPSDGQPDVAAPEQLGQAPVSAPLVPDHCVDSGAPTYYGDQSDPSQRLIWQSLPWGAAPGSGNPGQSGPAGDYAPGWRLPAITQAGAHPDGTTLFAWNRNSEGIGTSVGQIDGSTDNIVVDLPPGFVGNPQALPECNNEDFSKVPMSCPPETQVGVLRLSIEAIAFGGANLGNSYDTTYPVYNLEPRPGRVAELGFAYASGENAAAVRLTGKARTNGDFGVTAFAGQVPSALPPIQQSITLWGIPWARANDVWRPRVGHFEDQSVSPACKQQPGALSANQYIPPGGLRPECRASYDPSWGGSASGRAIRPFLTNETDCNPTPTVTLRTDSYQRPGTFTAEGDPDTGDLDWKTYESQSASVTGCDELEFEPDIAFAPSTAAADGATGLGVTVTLPQQDEPRNGAGAPLAAPAPGAAQPAIDEYVDDATAYWRSPAGWATAHLKDTVVTLPPGVSVNPSGATGLQGCSDAVVGVRQLGNPPLFNNVDPFDGEGVECPDGSKIGTVVVETPLLEEPLTGDAVLGEPKSTDPQSGEMLRMFLVLRSKERGLVAKVYGTAVADPGTGRVTATFENNPELPFGSLKVDFKGGSKGLLAMPQRCGTPGWTTTLTPWSAANGGGGQAVDRTGAFAVNANCAFGFAPRLASGMDTPAARASGSFTLDLSRSDGEQWIRGLTAKFPTGLLAHIKDVPLCSNVQAAGGSCPAESKIGILDGDAGSGDPFVLEEKGEIFLTEGYKGGEFGLMVKIRPIAGPFRGAMELSPIVVRQAISIDRQSAQATVVSDPIPLIHHGIPLRVRSATAIVNRPGFMINPSDCSEKRVEVSVQSAEGATANVADYFQAAGCGKLPFKPKLALKLTGRKQMTTGKHPGIRAAVNQAGVGEAAIEKAVVRLPKSLALDPNNAQALCEFEDGTKPDLENHCPKGSIVGRARAITPLLKDQLAGNVYFVKNVRRDPRTGNQIRTLPMIIVALRGQISVNLRGESDTTKSGKLVNTFASVPDAPVSSFNLNIAGGKNGILAVTRTRRARINLCKAGRQIVEADMDGHNGRRFDRDVKVSVPCKSAKKKKTRKR